MRNKAPSWIKPLISVLIGAAVVIYLFGFVITFSDQRVDAQLEHYDADQAALEIRLEDGASTVVPVADVPELAIASPDALRAAAAQQRAIEVIRPGLISQFQRVSALAYLAVFTLVGAVLALQAWRLQLIARSVGHRVSWWQAGQCLVIGLFYGNVIPAGQVGGDPIKALYLARMSDAPVSRMLAAVFIDRVLGLIAIVGIAGLALAPHLGNPRYSTALTAIGVVLVAATLASLMILSRRLRRFSGLDWLVGKLPGSPLERFVEAFASVRGDARLILSIVLSFVAQIGLGAAALITGLSIGVPGPGPLDYFGTVPVINVVTSVPGSPPGGWGVGEGAYMLFFGFYGVSAEAAVTLSIVPRFAMLLFSLLGLPAIVAARKRFGLGQGNASQATTSA